MQALSFLDAGDRAAQTGDRAQALASYGLALNHFLREGLHVMAAAVAQRMVEHFPDVVRARGTLAVLSLAEGIRLLSAPVVRSARREFDAYLGAARQAGQERAAVQQLRSLVDATESPVVREWLADYLDALGEGQAAEDVFLAAYEEREGLRSARAAAGDQLERWVGVLLAPARW